jgi:type III restriction enzyme
MSFAITSINGETCQIPPIGRSHPKRPACFNIGDITASTTSGHLGLEVPYRFGSETRRYIPDFIVLVEDGYGEGDLLHLVVEIKGYRREDAKDKKSTMENYWIPGVNNNGRYGRWAFAEFTEVYQLEMDFAARVEDGFNKMVNTLLT